MKKRFLVWVVLAVFGVLGISCATAGDIRGEVVGEAEWTIIGYLNGDNNLASSVRTLIERCETVTGSDEKTNILILYDGAQSKNLAKWSGSRLFLIKHDKEPFGEINSPYEDMGELDMGSAETVENLLNRVFREYPAKKTMFVFLGHGSGSAGTQDGLNYSFSPDDTSESGMTAVDMSDAVKRAIDTSNNGRKIDIAIIFSCLSNTLEIADEFKDIFSVVIGSPDEIVVFGGPYGDDHGRNGIAFWEAILAVKEDPEISGEKLSKRTIDASLASYRQELDRMKSGDYDISLVAELSASVFGALAAIDLGEMDRFMLHFEELSDLLKKRLEEPVTRGATVSALARASAQAQHYAGLEMIDLPDFLKELEKEFWDDELVVTAVGTVIDSYRDLIIYKRSEYYGNNISAGGMSIYMPHPIMCREIFDRYMNYYKASGFARETSWDEVMELYYQGVQEQKSVLAKN
ncbi:MAG: clostripain-related cysteine peptidase [Candidatus Falkowbacteria bacterium]